MDFIAKYFIKTDIQKKKSKDCYLSFNDLEKKISLWAKLFLDDNEKSEFSIASSLHACGFINQTLLLPEHISWFNDKELNYKILQLLVLKSIAIKKLNLNLEFNDKERQRPRYFTLTQSAKINIYLSQKIPEFKRFQEDIVNEIIKRKKEFKVFSQDLYSYWCYVILCYDEDENNKLNSKYNYFKFKSHDQVEVFLKVTVPLPYRNYSVEDSTNQKNNNIKKNQESINEKKRNQTEVVVKKDLSKEKINPVTHSFEKSEALDDYTNGNRFSSGDDELDSHQEALDELDLNNMTTEGDANSVVRQNIEYISLQQSQSESKSELTNETQVFFYPEWIQNKNKYFSNFTRVVSQNVNNKIQKDDQLLKNIISQNKKIIEKYKNMFQKILNEPLWKTKLREGSELDLDSVIRLLSDKNNQFGVPKIYSQKKSHSTDFQIHFLVDISYSTDTWVNQMKVIDIIRDSLVVFVESTKNLLEKISIALAYSQTRNHISYLEVKKSSENWSQFYSKLFLFKAQQYTRLGAAIRHSHYLIKKNKTDKNILVLVTDGKPTDLDPYEGAYGQSDVRKALDEVKSDGIKVLVLAVSDLTHESLNKLGNHTYLSENTDKFCFNLFKFISDNLH